METIRILLADDHRLMRAGMRALLRDISGAAVVAEASTGREAIDLVEQHRPDVVIMDIGMSDLNGLDAADRIIKTYPQCKVLILSMHSSKEYVVKALHIGVKGYLIKDAATSELEVAIRAVLRGETYLSPTVSTQLIGPLGELSLETGGTPEPLTTRQREILQLIAEGKSTKEIAALLSVSVKTVESHRTQLMRRLDIHDVAGLVRYAMRSGLVSTEQ